MKIECTKKDIEEAVDIVSRVASPSATLPVLRCVLFSVTDKNTVLKTTNLEIGIEKTLTSTVIEKGEVAIPAHILLSTLKTSPNHSKVVLSTDEATAVLEIGGAKTTIKTIPIDEFPSIPQPETSTSYTLPKDVLVKGIRNVLYSASTSLIKPELASVYMYHEGGELYFVATDSFRLAEQKIRVKLDDELPAVIMPIKNTTELVRILETQQEGDITIAVDENQYTITQEGLYVTSRIIDGSFPDYRSILPKEHTTDVVVLKNDFLQTLKKAQLFSDKFGQINLHIYPEKKTFTISSRNNDVGEIFDSLEAVVKGSDLDISFNYKYIMDVFHSISADSISLQFAGIGRPLIIQGVGDPSFTYLVMPMNR